MNLNSIDNEFSQKLKERLETEEYDTVGKKFGGDYKSIEFRENK